MSFNEKLRRLVFGTSRPAGVTNPLKDLPAGFTGMTWGGTGFDEPPEMPVALDETALPWELREDDDGGEAQVGEAAAEVGEEGNR